MATQKKAKRGDGAKPVTRWAVVRLGARSSWIIPYSLTGTQAEARDGYLRGWSPEFRAELLEEYDTTWTVRKVTISLA